MLDEDHEQQDGADDASSPTRASALEPAAQVKTKARASRTRVSAQTAAGGRRVVHAALGAPFFVLGLVTALAADDRTLSVYRAAALSVSFALALGAISVSFVVFQLAPYRNLVAGAPRRLLAGALAVAAIAAAPIAGLLVSSQVATRLAIGVIPSLIFASVILASLAQREGEPTAMIGRRGSDRRIRTYCWSAVNGLNARIAAEARLEALRHEQEPSLPPPTHEIFRHLTPPVSPNDPFDFLASLAATAVERRDVATYAAVVERVIEGQAAVRELHLGLEHDKRHRVRASLVDRAKAGLGDVARVARDDRVPSTFGERCVDICLDRVREAAEEGRQGDDEVLELWHVAADTAASLMQRGHGAALIEVLVVGHHATEAGLINVTDWSQRYALRAYAGSIAVIGERAVESGDVEALYRVLEALGWIGCAAILRGDHDVGTVAIQGLVHLGRLARRAKLECFWSRCLLAPVDHADERIQWVATWVPRLDARDQARWMSSLERAWSRLRGHPVSLSIDDTGELARITLAEQPSAYVEHVNDNGRLRAYDYSDLDMSKNAELH